MNTLVLAVLSMAIVFCTAQRSPYAGRGPVGYPALASTTTTVDPLADRFGEEAVSTTTIRLPVEALGDVELYKSLLKLPIDRQPYWLLNWQALEAQRRNPQTYTSNRNSFIDNQG